MIDLVICYGAVGNNKSAYIDMRRATSSTPTYVLDYESVLYGLSAGRLPERKQPSYAMNALWDVMYSIEDEMENDEEMVTFILKGCSNDLWDITRFIEVAKSVEFVFFNCPPLALTHRNRMYKAQGRMNICGRVKEEYRSHVDFIRSAGFRALRNRYMFDFANIDTSRETKIEQGRTENIVK